MTPEDASQVWRAVWRRMGQWETDDGDGSARPAFVAAWTAATEVAGVRWKPADLEAAWSRWLQAGTMLTRAHMTVLLAGAARRGKNGQLFGLTALRTQLRLVRREPGQEG
jgi:hypothetical protein